MCRALNVCEVAERRAKRVARELSGRCEHEVDAAALELTYRTGGCGFFALSKLRAVLGELNGRAYEARAFEELLSEILGERYVSRSYATASSQVLGEVWPACRREHGATPFWFTDAVGRNADEIVRAALEEGFADPELAVAGAVLTAFFARDGELSARVAEELSRRFFAAVDPRRSLEFARRALVAR